MIRELWARHMDARRALSVGLGLVAYGLGVLFLAVAPGFVSGADPRGLAPAVGGAAGMAIRGYAFHRRSGRRDGLRWALVQGGLMLLVILGMFALATVIHPVAQSSQALGGDAWLGLAAVGAIVAMTSNVLWERNRHRQRVAAVLLAAVCLIVAGVAGLRAGGPWIPIGTAFILAGVLGVAVAALQGLSHLLQTTGDPAT